MRFTLSKFEANPILKSDDNIDKYTKYDLRIAENTILAYIAKFYVKNFEEVKEMYRKYGDLGIVAAECLK